MKRHMLAGLGAGFLMLAFAGAVGLQASPGLLAGPLPAPTVLPVITLKPEEEQPLNCATGLSFVTTGPHSGRGVCAPAAGPTTTTVPATATSVPATATSVPPTATSVPPTATSVPPTATSVPPTATTVPATPTPTSTPPPPPSGSPGVVPDNPLTLGDCTQADHDTYVTAGPDGNAYRSWHPIRRVRPDGSSCHFAHEHGDPLPPGAPAPAFGYAAVAANMPAEVSAHSGFKLFGHRPGNLTSAGFPDGAYTGQFSGAFYFVLHMGTAGRGRLVVRHHSVEFWSDNGTRIHLMADTGALNDKCNEGAVNPARNVVSHCDAGYETWAYVSNVGGAWRANVSAAVTNPMNHMHYAGNARGVQPVCADAGCTNITLIPNSSEFAFLCGTCPPENLPFGDRNSGFLGERRTLHDPGWVWANAGGATAFCTDPFGTRQACGQATSIPQQVAAINLGSSSGAGLLGRGDGPSYDQWISPIHVRGAPGGN